MKPEDQTPVPSPCINVCHMIPETGLCQGCMRTIDELGCGGNAALQEAWGCRIAIPAAEAGKVRDWDEDALSYRATGQQCARFTFDETVSPGDVLHMGDLAWQALAAPGHDPHALLFWCAQ